MTTVEVFAPAKINLTLHITGQRPDGYHLLDSLVAFAGIGDRLTLTASDAPAFTVSGPFASAVPLGDDNLVLKAARLVPGAPPLAIHLEKRLPPSSGIGGGSADAAAAFRGLLVLSKDTLPAELDESTIAPYAASLEGLGADVTMCLLSAPVRVRGIGERLDPIPALPSLAAVLVNPKRALSTPSVFAALSEKNNPPMPETLPAFPDAEALVSWLATQRNDLEAPAIGIVPQIADILATLDRSDRVLLARMSGSGATCIGYCRDRQSAEAAAERIGRDQPDWWVKSAVIGGQSSRALPVTSPPHKAKSP